MKLQEQLFEECCVMLSYAQRNLVAIPSKIHITMNVFIKNRQPQDLRDLHRTLQKLISPIKVESLVQKTSRAPSILVYLGFGLLAIGLTVFAICSALFSTSPTIQHAALLGAILAANSLYFLSELKAAMDSFLHKTVINGLSLRLGIGIFCSIVMLEIVFVDTNTLQNSRLLQTLFVFAFPFAIFHLWDFLCIMAEKLFSSKEINMEELVIKEIVLLHKYAKNSSKAHMQCQHIQHILHTYKPLQNFDLLDKYATEDTQQYLELVLFTIFVADKKKCKKDHSAKDFQINTHIEKTLHKLRDNVQKQPNDARNSYFEQEFVCIKDKKDDAGI